MVVLFFFRINTHEDKIFGLQTFIQLVKNLLVMQETRVQSLGWKYPLEKEMATHSSSLAWEISRTEEPGGLQSVGSQKKQTGQSD